MYDELSKNHADCDEEQQEIILIILKKTLTPYEKIQIKRMPIDTPVTPEIQYWNIFVQCASRDKIGEAFLAQISETHNAHYAIGKCVRSTIAKM